MALAQFSFTKPGTDPGMQKFARDRQIAEALAQQSMAPDQTQMAGGYAIPQTALNPLAKMAQALASRKINERTDAGERDYMRQKNEEVARAIAEAERAGQGREALPAIDAPPEELGGGPGRPALEALAPNPMRTYRALAGIDDPMVKQFGLQAMLAGMTPKATKIQRVELPDGQGGTRVGFVDMNNPNPMSTFQEGGVQPPKLEMVNTGGQVVPVNLYQAQGPMPVTAAPGAVPFAATGMTPEQYRKHQESLAVKGAPRNNNTVINAGPKAFETELGKADAEQLTEWRKNAQAAQSTLGTVANLRSAIERGVYSGGVANLKTEAANLINGITGITPKKLPGSQLFNAEASKLILDQVKLLGANPSNADREFIEKTVPRLASSPEARDELIRYLEGKANRSIQLFQDADTYARQNRGLGGFKIIQPSGGAPAPYGGPERRANPPGGQPAMRFDANGNPVKP